MMIHVLACRLEGKFDLDIGSSNNYMLPMYPPKGVRRVRFEGLVLFPLHITYKPICNML